LEVLFPLLTSISLLLGASVEKSDFQNEYPLISVESGTGTGAFLCTRVAGILR